MNQNIPSDLIAFNFNLYEDEIENQYNVELIGCKEYDKDNDDWACTPDYSTGENNMYAFSADGWEEALDLCVKLIRDYLQTCSVPNQLTKAAYITAGFVDGDLEVIRD